MHVGLTVRRTEPRCRSGKGRHMRTTVAPRLLTLLLLAQSVSLLPIAGCGASYEVRRERCFAQHDDLINANLRAFERWEDACDGDPACLSRARSLFMRTETLTFAWLMANATNDFRRFSNEDRIVADMGDRLLVELDVTRAMRIHDPRFAPLPSPPIDDAPRPEPRGVDQPSSGR